jgi:PPOX class probable F420-dependent enzyme
MAEGSSVRQADGGYFAPLASTKYMLLSTLRLHGAPVSTRVRVVVDGDQAYFRIRKPSGTWKHLRHADWVQVAPCGVLGLCRFGPWLDAAPRLLDGEEASQAAEELARQHPIRRGRLSPLASGLWRGQPIYFELLACDPADTPEADNARPEMERLVLWPIRAEADRRAGGASSPAGLPGNGGAGDGQSPHQPDTQRATAP